MDFQSFRPVANNFIPVSAILNWSDYWGAIKVRWGIGRDSYTVAPGLYKVGNPNPESDVFVSANYKLSFDTLRKNLHLLNSWILVIDTKGINVWCAAGKGTFGTDNLVKSIKSSSLSTFVSHRRIIVPQLGAVGVAAYKVKDQSGFRVIFGPVRAKEIKDFVQAGYKATPAMRTNIFPIQERAKLIPVDLMYRKYELFSAMAILFFISGLDRTGFLFSKMLETSCSPLMNILGAYFAGIVLAPLFLPWIPFRAFSLKGAFWGAVVTLSLHLFFQSTRIETVALGLMNIAIASFMTMNYTGSSTYTSLSGVKAEMKLALPIQITFFSFGLILFILSKLI